MTRATSRCLLSVLLGLVSLSVAPAATITWTGSVNGTWDVNTTPNWTGDSTWFNNGDAVTFGDTGANTALTVAGGGVSPGSVLFNNSALSYSLGGAGIGGAAGLTKTGTGTLTLTSNTNSYSGGTFINAGTVNITTSGNAGASALPPGQPVTVSGAALRLGVGDAIGWYGGNPSMINVYEGGVVTVAAGVHDSVSAFTLRGGTITSEGAGDATGNYIFDGTITTLASATTSVISANKIYIRNGGTFDVAAGTTASGIDLDVSAILTANPVVKNGVGLMRLTALNTYGGGTTINAGTLQITNAGALGSGAATVATGATLLISSGGTVANAMTLNGTGVGGNGVLVIDTAASTTLGGAITLASDSTLNVVSGLATLNYPQGLTGPGALTKTGAGTLLLHNGGGGYLSNSTGGLNVNAGTFQVDSSARWGGSNILVNAGGTLLITTGGGDSIDNARGITIAGGGVFDFQQAATETITSLSLAGAGSGAGALVNTAATAANLTPSAGTTLTADTAIGVTQAGASLQLNNGISGGGFGLTKIGPGSLILTGDVANLGATTVNAGNLVVRRGANSDRGILSGSSGLFINSGGTVTVDSINGLAGYAPANILPVTINAGGTLTMTDGKTCHLNAVTLAGGDLSSTVAPDGTYGSWSLDGPLTVPALAITSTLSATRAYLTGQPITVAKGTSPSGIDLDVTGSFMGTGALDKFGDGTMVLRQANTYTGWTGIEAGVLNIRNGGALGTGANTSVRVGAALEVQGDLSVTENLNLNGTGVAGGGSLRSLSGVNTVTGTVQLDGDASIAVDAGTLTLNQGVGRYSGAPAVVNLSKTGAGMLVLKGLGTYTGTTTVQGGTLALAAGGSATTGTLPPGQDVTVTNATLQLNVTDSMGWMGGNPSMIYLDHSTMTTGGGSLHSSVGNFTLIAGTITAPDSGDGNNYIFDGTITVNASATPSVISAPRFDLRNGGTFDVAAGGTLAVSSVIGGAKGFTKAGAGTMILSGANIFSGWSEVQAGVVNIRNGGALSSGSNISVRDGAALEVQDSITVNKTINVQGTGIAGAGSLRSLAGDNTLSGQVQLDNDATVGVDAGKLILTQGVARYSGAPAVVSLTKVGAGTLVLNGAGTYTGTTTIDAGTLQIFAANALSGGAVAVTSGATLQISSGGTVANAMTLNGAGVGGNGVLVIDTAASTTLGGAITLASDSTLNVVAGQATLNNPQGLTGPGALTKTGAGTLLLHNGGGGYLSNSTGGLIVNAGTFQVDSSARWGGSNILVNAGGTLLITTGGGDSIENARGITVAGGGVFDFQQAATETIASLSLAGAGSGAGALVNTAATAAYLTPSAGTTLTADTTIGVTQAGASLQLNNAISGAFALTKVGAGTLTLTSNANNYSGGTFINAGTVNITAGGSASASALPPGRPVTVSNATLRLGVTDAIGWYGGNPSMINVYEGGVVTVAAGVHDSVSAFTLRGGTITSEGAGDAAGNYLFDATITTLASATTSVISANKIQIRNGGTFAVAVGTTPSLIDLAVSSQLTGNALTKTGPGTMMLSGANTYGGSTTILAGNLVAGNDQALSTVPVYLGDTTGSATAALIADADGRTIANAITVRSGNTGTAALGGVNTSGNSTFTGAITLGSVAGQGKGVTLAGMGGGQVTFSGAITRLTDDTSAGVTLFNIGGTGTATIQLTNQNNYAGGTRIASGTRLLVAGTVDTPTGLSPLGLNVASNAITLAGGTLEFGAMSEAAHTYAPGLAESYVLQNQDTNTVDVTSPGTYYANTLGVKMGQISVKSNPLTRTPATVNDTSWGDYETWIYKGQFYDADGHFSFAEQIDDRVRMWVDGVLRLNNDAWNAATGTGDVGNMGPLGDGWHDIEIRMQNGNGGAGASGQGTGWSGTYGFGLSGSGTKPTVDTATSGNNGGNYYAPADPGDGSLFRTVSVSTAATTSLVLNNAVNVTADSVLNLGTLNSLTVGGVTIGSARLDVAGPAGSSLTMTRLYGAGQIVLDGVALTVGTVDPADKLSIVGPFTLDGRMQADLGGVVQGQSYDWIDVTGTAILADGSVIDVNAVNSFTIPEGMHFDILTATGGIQANLANLTFDFSGAPSGNDSWVASIVQIENGQALRLEAVPEPVTLTMLLIGVPALASRLRRRMRR